VKIKNEEVHNLNLLVQIEKKGRTKLEQELSNIKEGFRKTKNLNIKYERKNGSLKEFINNNRLKIDNYDNILSENRKNEERINELKLEIVSKDNELERFNKYNLVNTNKIIKLKEENNIIRNELNDNKK
jgi:hypothetical protein